MEKPISNFIEFLEADERFVRQIESFFSKSPTGFWKYEYQGLLPDKSVFIAAVAADGTLIGTQAVMPYELMVKGKPMLTARSERTLVSSTFRGGRIFPKMMQMCVEGAAKKGVQFIWGFTRTIKPFKRQGFYFTDNYNLTALMNIDLSGIGALYRSEKDLRKRLAEVASSLPSQLIRRNKPPACRWYEQWLCQ